MADLTFTTIEESARHSLNISRDEYAACNYIQTWASYPSNNTPGFCNRTRGQMALFIGISERGMQKMLTRLEGMDLIKRASQTQFLYRITEKWFDVVVSAKEQRTGEQSSRQGVNKVPAGGEQSSRQGVNKVPTHKEYNKEVNNQQQKTKIDVAVFDSEVNALVIDSIPLEAKKENPTPIPPPPPQPSRPAPGESATRRWDAFDIDKEAEAMKEDYRVCEKFASDLRMSLADAKVKLPLSIDEFVSDQKAVTYNYQNPMQMRRHYFNWILTAPAAKAAANKQMNGASQSPHRVTVSTSQTQTRY